MKQIYKIILLLFFTATASTAQINIYYPNNNTTSDCYYANISGYNHIMNNTIDDNNLSVLIVKNQPITDDIINNPSKLADMKYIGLFILIGLFGFVIIGLVKVFKRSL